MSSYHVEAFHRAEHDEPVIIGNVAEMDSLIDTLLGETPDNQVAALYIAVNANTSGYTVSSCSA